MDDASPSRSGGRDTLGASAAENSLTSGVRLGSTGAPEFAASTERAASASSAEGTTANAVLVALEVAIPFRPGRNGPSRVDARETIDIRNHMRLLVVATSGAHRLKPAVGRVLKLLKVFERFFLGVWNNPNGQTCGPPEIALSTPTRPPCSFRPRPKGNP
jgi:hypothetical protein